MEPSDARKQSGDELRPLAVGVRCPDCGYDLRGSTSERCPECGFALEVLRTSESQIPWSHRAQLGGFKAYWKTVWLVSRRPKHFCLEMSRPVSYADSQSFRGITTFHAWATIVVISASLCLFLYTGGSQHVELVGWVLGGVVLWSLLLLAALPGLASYFFQSRRLTMEQQNRAMALSYYAWAPLAWTPLALPFLAAALLTWKPWGSTHVVFGCITAGVCMSVVALSDKRVRLFMRYTLEPRWGPRFFRVVLLRILGVGLGFLLVLAPLSILYVLVIFHSLC